MEWAVKAMPWPLYSEEKAPLDIVQEAGQACGLRKISPPTGVKLQNVQPEASHCTECAIPKLLTRNLLTRVNVLLRYFSVLL
jgi:hypothetical protein